MDAYTSQFTSAQIDQGLNVALGMIQIISLITQYGYDVSTIQNHPEWSYVVLDSSDKILAGIRVDGSAYMAIL
jgi:hypothetical protein